MKIGTKIRALRKQKGLTILQLATAIDSDVGNISRLERNIQGYSESTLTKIAAALGVTVADLFSDTTTQQQDDNVEFVGFVPNGMVKVVGEAFLGIDGAVDMIEALEGWVQIYSDDKDSYALKVKGDSMWPRIQSGEYVVVEPNTVVRSGDEVFVRTVEGKNMVKILNKTRDGSYQFTSVNNTHPPITVDPREVEKMHYVAAIVKPTKFIDKCEQS
ncbi:XRE family transcriptional regulator [Morganella morganii]|uniref:XRE family transcriptional regulator n=1 Tax=Morganella morganii TaxID=582 RepID=UPI001BDB0E9E|nr:S24 family peptidase [Morganella morganii]MBT0422940.1 helix-turn-helix transcriptional regulator [Morganella morganii subsp. morganii]MBT0517524.1 helix-turn-helix transcriptional regulator [Morganella morganii subsp. morganii]QWM05722.1 helix-turn-helix transcriptional regulator [Morganella morganii subsp. morganii]HCT7641263.1 helix-turn-helix transcriptional regulator [Morganella morganii]HCU1239731.1 helix-turn-helix transcriptional regulator [Morganella morganii]